MVIVPRSSDAAIERLAAVRWACAAATSFNCFCDSTGAAGKWNMAPVLASTSNTMLSCCPGSTMVMKCRVADPAPETISLSTRVRPAASRNILPRVSTMVRLPSGRSWVDCLTTSAEKGAPAMDRKLVPADIVLVEAELVFLVFWLNKGEAPTSRAQRANAQTADLMISPGRMATLYSELFRSPEIKSNHACSAAVLRPIKKTKPPLLATGDFLTHFRVLRRTLYARPTPRYSKPRAFIRGPSSRFLVSTTTGLRMMRRMRSKSSVRNSGQPVPSTSASAPSATEYAESQYR